LRAEAVYSPKHRSGQCHSRPSRRTIRKDTAAYASLSFFTCQRATSEDAVSEDNSASHRNFRFEPLTCQGNIGAASSWQRRDEPDLGSFGHFVNPVSEKLENSADLHPKMKPPEMHFMSRLASGPSARILRGSGAARNQRRRRWAGYKPALLRESTRL
jgi:hypothetical protein